MTQLVEYGFLAVTTLLLQGVQAQVPGIPDDPLISQGRDAVIYVGLVLLVLAIAFAIKSFDSKFEHIIIAAFMLCVVLVVILWYL